MSKPKASMGNVIRFPVEAITKYGFERVKARRKSSTAEQAGQINMFDSPGQGAEPGTVVPLPTGIGPFEEALLLDEQGSDSAADIYWKAIEEEDSVADAYCNLGIMESQRGNAAKAIDCFTNSLQQDPRQVVVCTGSAGIELGCASELALCFGPVPFHPCGHAHRHVRDVNRVVELQSFPRSGSGLGLNPLL